MAPANVHSELESRDLRAEKIPYHLTLVSPGSSHQLGTGNELHPAVLLPTFDQGPKSSVAWASSLNVRSLVRDAHVWPGMHVV